MNEWDIRLTRLSEENKNVHRFELASLIADYGRKQFYSEKFWYMGSIPYDMKALHVLAAAMSRALHVLEGTRKKVLVLDLDNTLWGGVVGEDGPTGIRLDEAHEGAIYRDAQIEIKKMQKVGVVLAIASKNNMEDVESVFAQNPHMVLKKEDFAAIYANWNPKSENIRQIAAELNLGLDSFVFLDDNEVERKAVEMSIPEVTVAEFPADITQLANAIKEIYNCYFQSWVITEEDREKTKQYQEEHLRKEEQKTAVSFEDYLKSLETVIRLREVDEKTKERAVQLMNKTNQFNVCTLRMNELELEQYLNEQGGHLLMAEVSDKYGNSGWVAEFLYHMEENRAVVDNFLMSCRVMGRKIEHAIFGAVLEKLKSQGVEEIRASYYRTPKNKPVEHLWSELGFTEMTEQNYYMMVAEQDENISEKIHTVLWESLDE
jgi:FkbH-like protein